MTRRLAALAIGCAALPAALPAALRAQAPTPVRCTGQTVHEIVVYASAPTVAGAARVPMLRDLVRATHMTTDPELTRRYLQLTEGQPCTELRRTESERVLRAQPFIADANVLAYADSTGGVRVEVHTIDEASLLAGARMSGGNPFVGLLRLGNANLLGQGVLASAEWRSGGAHRDGYSLSFADHQFAGQPWVLALDLRRAPLGGAWNVEASHPFLTDLQANAWRVHGGEATDYVRLRQPDADARAVPVYRAYADVGVLSRVGPPRHMLLLGATVSHERERTTNEVLVLDRYGSRPDSGGVPAMDFAPHTMARLNLLGGVRLLDYVRVSGFDGLSGTQDFPIGLQAGAVAGRSFAALGSREDDWFTSLDIYAAMGTTERATRLRLQGEGRYDRALSRWDGVAASGSLTHYAKLGEHNTTVLSADWAGGWRPRVPGQLELGAPDGMRGFAALHEGGARRMVVTAEQRRVLGRLNGTAELGGALFVDAGRVWSGDVPYGLTSPWRASMGVSLLAALPVRSTRLWRVDLAVPSSGGGIRRWEVRVSHAGPFSLSRVDGSALNGMRARAVPASVFLWP